MNDGMFLVALVLSLACAACGDDVSGGADAGGGTDSGSASGTATELCTITCEKKDSCGLLNPTTVEECIFGCEQILATTFSCVPPEAEVTACRNASPGASCVVIAAFSNTGGPAECLPCFEEMGGDCTDLQSCCDSLDPTLQSACTSVVSDDDAATCGQVLDSYRFEGLCS